MSTSIKTRIKNKIDTTQNWKSQQRSSLVLLSGEVAFEKSTSDGTVNFKVGDGVQQYADLPYAMTKTYIKDTTSQEYADGKQTDLSVIKLSSYEEYAQILEGDVPANALYIMPAEYENAFGQQIKNVAPGTDLSDAVTVGQVNAVSSQLSGKEDMSNKVTMLLSTSTDDQYPTAKCMYDIIGNIEAALDIINNGGAQ